jgi:hypothetical protein
MMSDDEVNQQTLYTFLKQRNLSIKMIESFDL